MEQNEKLKEMRMALNARLFLLFIGIMMIVNAVTTTGRNGLSWLNLANMVTEIQTGGTASHIEEETEPSGAMTEKVTVSEETELDIETIAAQMEEVGVTADDLKLLGIICLITAAFEAIIGLICALLSNRVDRSKITLSAVVLLLVVECVFLIVLAVKGALMISNLIYSLLLPLVLLWSVFRLRKLAKADPDRIYAVKQNRQPQKPAMPVNSAPKKGLKERAMMSPTEETDADAAEEPKQEDEFTNP